MRHVLLFLFLLLHGTGLGQNLSVTITETGREEKKPDPALLDLYAFMKVQRYTARFKMPDKKRHDVVLVKKSVYKDSVVTADTLWNSLPWQKKLVGGIAWDPTEGATFMARKVDSTHYEIRFKVRMPVQRTIELPWPNNGYMLDEGLSSGGGPVKMELGVPMPIMVLTQPYPDPPPPKEAVIQRYCFGSDIPPEQWPGTYGVPHLYVFELTILP